MVLREMGFVEEGDAIYKLVGPILVKQELDESKINLEKRVNFINDEMYILYFTKSFCLNLFYHFK